MTIEIDRPAVTTTQGSAGRHLVNLETREGVQRQVDVDTMRSLGLELRDWATGIDLVDVFLPLDGGAPVVHTFSRWSDGKGGVLGDRYYEPSDAVLTELRVRFDEPAIVATSKDNQQAAAR